MNDNLVTDSPRSARRLAVIGAGPVGLSLALQAARALPDAHITLFDARTLDHDVAADPRTLALSLGSVQLLERLGAWNADAAHSILEVHVSQQPPSLPSFLGSWLSEPCLRIRAADEGVPLLGAVLSYGSIVSTLQQVWMRAQAAEPHRLHNSFGRKVTGLKNWPQGGVEVASDIAEPFDLAVVAEGGVFADQSRKSVTNDYQQTAWVGSVGFENPIGHVAYERFTRHGPVALLPLTTGRAGLVWCVPTPDDPVANLTDAQRLTVLSTQFHADVGRLTDISPLKHFALGLNAERSLTEGRIVRIGNAAQTLHPVAGQGLNLGLRDACELVHSLSRNANIDSVLRRLEWQRGPDRWAMIAATDFLARSFTWKLPGAGAARGLGIAALQQLRPVKSALARQMMFG
jgi:2-octaprenyl-6-methoxyphenol hydroxylase